MAEKNYNKYQLYLLKILRKYNEGKATDEESDFLASMYDSFELKEDLVTKENESEFSDIKENIKSTVDKRIDQYDRSKSGGHRLIWIRYAAAVLLLTSFSIGAYFFTKHKPGQNPQAKIVRDIAPGGNKAILTLSNGTEITLNDAHKGEIAKQSNINIAKTADNQIVYTVNQGGDAATAQPASELQNTISTPNGGQYNLVLPDGTKVFLNAATSLTYPAAFHGSERVVHLDGEAYFEVAKNKAMPFKVMSGSQTIEVLGTHFNINAYQDEAKIKTTLLQGSVRVSSGANSALIVPGQQATVSRAQPGEITEQEVDVEKETAWKNGLFSFKQDDIRSVMRQVARWYDVRIVYDDHLPAEKFNGEISRNSNLSDVFKILELNDFRFEANGKTVTVSAR